MTDLPIPYRRWTDDEQVSTQKPLPWTNKLEELQAWMNERTANSQSNMDLPNAVMNAIPRTSDDMYGAALPPWTKVKGNPDVIDMGKARMALDAPDFVKGGKNQGLLSTEMRDKEASDYINNAYRMNNQTPRQELKTIPVDNYKAEAEIAAAKRDKLNPPSITGIPNIKLAPEPEWYLGNKGLFLDHVADIERSVYHAKTMQEEVKALDRLKEIVRNGKNNREQLGLGDDFFKRMKENHGIAESQPHGNDRRVLDNSQDVLHPKNIRDQRPDLVARAKKLGISDDDINEMIFDRVERGRGDQFEKVLNEREEYLKRQKKIDDEFKE